MREPTRRVKVTVYGMIPAAIVLNAGMFLISGDHMPWFAYLLFDAALMWAILRWANDMDRADERRERERVRQLHGD